MTTTNSNSISSRLVVNTVCVCEPWRKTNPELVESDNKLKEWANSFREGKYEEPYGFFMWWEFNTVQIRMPRN